MISEMPPNNNRIRFYVGRLYMYVCMTMCMMCIQCMARRCTLLYSQWNYLWERSQRKREWYRWKPTCTHSRFYLHRHHTDAQSSSSPAATASILYNIWPLFFLVRHIQFTIRGFMCLCSMFYYCHISYLWFTAISINCCRMMFDVEGSNRKLVHN